MRKRIIGIFLIGLMSFSFVGCNTSARSFGGTMEVELEPGQKLIEATWKDEELWYLTREMREDEYAETFILQDKTNFGMFEGKVIFKEQERE